MCVCRLRYPACNAHAPYCRLWPARLYINFPLYLYNGKIYERKLLKIKYVLIFSTNVTEKFLILRRTERDVIKNIHLYSCNAPHFFRQILLNLELCRQIFEKYSSINSLQWRRSCSTWTDGRMDRRTDRRKDIKEVTSRFSQFRNAPKNDKSLLVL